MAHPWRAAGIIVVICSCVALKQHAPITRNAASGSHLQTVSTVSFHAGSSGVARRALAPTLPAQALLFSRACAPCWRLVASPNPGTSVLNGVAAVSARDAWAVGATGLGMALAVPINRPLIEHWDGTRWQVIDAPLPRGAQPSALDVNGPRAFFNAVAAVSAHDVWAVGSIAIGAAGSRPLIARWDGTRWRLVTSPNPGADSVLNAVAAISARDVWAVGTVHGRRTLAEHWDGQAWRIVSTPPRRGHDVSLAGVAAVSARDVWAVGTWGSAADGSRRGLVERWDGRSWRVIPNPQPGAVDDALNGISAGSATEVWAAGSAEGNDYENGPLVERWTGTAWRVVPSPALPAGQDTDGLTSVAAVGPDDVWVTAGGAFAHWTGTRWTTTTLGFTPYRGGTSYTQATTGDFHALAALSATNLWAVGQLVENTDQEYATLTAHYGMAS